MYNAAVACGGRPGIIVESEAAYPGRVLSVHEFIEKLRTRTDIFAPQGDQRTRNIEVLSMILAIAAGSFFSTREIVPFVHNPDFYTSIPKTEGARLIKEPIERPDRAVAQKAPTPTSPIAPESQRTIKSAGKSGQAKSARGGGNPRARVAQTGVLGFLSKPISGIDVTGGEPFAKGGVADQIDAVFQGMNGLKTGSRAGTGRRQEEAIGFGPGYESGFGGTGSGEIHDYSDRLMEPSVSSLPVSRPHTVRNLVSLDTRLGAITGSGRTKSGVLRVVTQHLPVLRYAYNQRLRVKPGLQGKITIKFAVDEFGVVIYCKVEESTVSDDLLETMILQKISRWRFDKIDKPGDITEIVYPFVFSS